MFWVRMNNSTRALPEIEIKSTSAIAGESSTPVELLGAASARRRRHPRRAHVDPRPAKRHALGLQQRALALALGQRAVGAHDALPRQRRVGVGGEHGARAARRAGAEVAVGRDVAGRDRADGGEDLVVAGRHRREASRPVRTRSDRRIVGRCARLTDRCDAVTLPVVTLLLLALGVAEPAAPAAARVVATSAGWLRRRPALTADGRLVLGERILSGIRAFALDPTGTRAPQTLATFPETKRRETFTALTSPAPVASSAPSADVMQPASAHDGGNPDGGEDAGPDAAAERRRRQLPDRVLPPRHRGRRRRPRFTATIGEDCGPLGGAIRVHRAGAHRHAAGGAGRADVAVCAPPAIRRLGRGRAGLPALAYAVVLARASHRRGRAADPRRRVRRRGSRSRHRRHDRLDRAAARAAAHVTPIRRPSTSRPSPSPPRAR